MLFFITSKTLMRNYSAFIYALCTLCSFVACSTDDYTSPHDVHLCEVPISIAPSSTSNVSDDLIAVQIYEITDDDNLIPYAYGLFDSYDLPPMQIQEGRQYTFTATVVIDGKNVIGSYSYGYDKPFVRNNSLYTKLTGEFVIDHSTYFSYMERGEAKVVEGIHTVSYTHPFIQRYVGYSSEFNSTVEEPISVQMRRVYSDLEFSVEGLISGEGHLAFEIEDAPEVRLTAQDSVREVSMCFSGTVPSSRAWIEDGYYEDITYDLTYIDKYSRRYVIAEQELLTLERNITQPIVIIINTVDKTITFEFESGELSEEEEVVIEWDMDAT